MRPTTRVAALLGAPVCVEETRVGEVTGILADHGTARLLGLEVSERTGKRLFLPWVGAQLEAGAVQAHSALVLIDLGDLGAYVRRGAVVVTDLAALRGWSVDGAGRLERAGVDLPEPVGA